jgi:hypothetical protein
MSEYYTLPYPFGKTIDDVGFEKANLTLDTKDRVPRAIGGSFVINQLSIETRQGLQISLLEAFESLDIEENIFSSAIVGSVTLTDVGGGIEKFQLQGGEKLLIQFAKPNTNEILIWREDLIINKIGAHTVNMDSLGARYLLYFSSRSFVNSMKKNLYKSYKNMSIATAVRSIFSEMSSNDLMLEDPKITINNPFISTGLMPHKAIEALAQRSCSKSKFFLFFERFFPVVGTYADGKPFASTHFFGSYDKLVEDSTTGGIHNVFYSPNDDAKIEPSYIRTKRLTKKDNFNHLEMMLFGHYNTTITSLDPIKRTSTVTNIGYSRENNNTKDFYPNKLLDKNNIFNTYNDINGEIPGRKLIFSSSHFNDPIQRTSWLKDNIFGSLSKSMFKLEVDIQGATNNIGAGHIVNLVIPSALDKKMLPGQSNLLTDEYHSGRYFVSGVKHNITLTTYVKRLELSRGSIPIDFNRNDLTAKDLSELVYI